MNNDIDTSDLIAKYITDTLSEEEEAVLEKWLEDPYNRLQFDLITSGETIQRNREEFQRFNPEDDWSKLNRKISGNKRILCWLKYAAVILLPIGLGILVVYYSNEGLKKYEYQAKNEFLLHSEDIMLELHDGNVYTVNKDTSISKADIQINIDSSDISYTYQAPITELEYNVISIPRGKQYQLTLSDSTKIWLNADTRFKYPIAFVGQTREVFIENGEVFFDVAKNKNKPFVVHFNNHAVKVLGTKFNVKSYDDNENDQVTLAEGSILIDDSISGVELSPNQQAVINRKNKRIRVIPVDADIFCAWKNQRFVYKQEKLEEIMTDFSRFFNINVFYRNERIKEEVFSLRLSQDDSFETILEHFELTGKVQFEMNKNNIIVQ